MAHLIDKDTLVAEIEKHRAIWDGMDCDYCKGQRMAYSDVISFLNTLEVKEVDLNDAVERYVDQHKSELSGYFDIRRIARHFYELGLKAQKGE